MIDLQAAIRKGFGGVFRSCLLALLVSFLLNTSGAFAQFGVESDRGDRPMGGMRHGGGMRDDAVGTGIGIGIGIGIELGRAAAERAAEEEAKKAKKGGGTATSSDGPRRAARKGDPPAGAKQAKKDPKKKDGDAPPTPFSKDPADGIDVLGGKAHRGTGTITGYKGGPRPGIYCWVHLTDTDKCKKTAQYQFVTVNIEAKWGSDPKANINDLVKKFRANDGGFLPVTENGVYEKPGQLVGDDFKGTRKQNTKTNVHMKDPDGKDVEAGPYTPRDIPGAEGDKGLIDAPYWRDTLGPMSGAFAPESLRKQKKSSATQPAESDAGEITVLQHFRTYVYCMEPYTCLGYFEWDYNETIAIVMKWREATKGSDLGDETFGGNMQAGGGKKKGKGQQAEPAEEKTWVPYFEAKGTSKVDGPTIGEWKPCP